MCGLFAVLSRRQPITTDYSPVLAGIRHRGPDDVGVETVSLHSGADQPRDRAWLGHARLSILDLSARGHQPMHSASGRFSVIFNGEIYNYIEIRNELIATGVTFSTNSDTEVLLQAWEAWGEQCLPRLKGMFACVLIDKAAGKAFLVRDFFGIKPLYYAQTEDEIIICSEPLPILSTGRVGGEIDRGVAYEYIRFGAANALDRSIFTGIDILPAAHLLTFDFASGALEPARQYWALKATERKLSFEDAAAECRDRFMDNIRLHLRSDVPVGAALSGGIDSSAVVCAMRILEPDLDLQTFSYIAAEPEHSEEKWVDVVHAQVGGVCHKIRPEPEDLAADLTTLVRRQGEPFGSASMYAQYRVFQRAREVGVPVTLDGQGADELLGGYWPHVGTFAAERLAKGRVDDVARLLLKSAQGPRGVAMMSSLLAQSLLPKSLRSAARSLVGREVFPSYLNRDWFSDGGVDWTGAADALIGRHTTLKGHLISATERGSLPNLLRYADRNSMAFSIESRVPFLTQDFASFLLSLPAEYLVSRDGVRKHVFREAMKDILPEAIRQRRDKIGFFADDGLWLRRNADHFEGAWEKVYQAPMFDRAKVQEFVEGFMAGRHEKAALVWRILVFGLWLEEVEATLAAARARPLPTGAKPLAATFH